MSLTTNAQIAIALRPDYTPQLISGGFAIGGALIGVLAVLIGFFLQRWAKSYDERKKVKAEFEAHRTGIVFESVMNNLGPRLFQLKKILTDNPEILLNNQTVRDFMMKWLAGNPAIDLNIQAGNIWNSASRQEMITDLLSVKL